MIQITLPVIIISLQINIVSQECTNTQDTIGMHKPIAWAQVTFLELHCYAWSSPLLCQTPLEYQ